MHGTLPALNRNFDYCTEYGATILVNRIRDFWAARGLEATVYEVQDQMPRGTMPLHCVRSRMVGGLPQ